MRRLRTFLLLPRAERHLLVRALALLWAIRLGLWVLRFRNVRRLLARLSRGRDGWDNAPQFAPDRIAWAVEVLGRHLPGTKNCLVQAMATEVLLARRGHPSRLPIGVARGRQGQLEAHAWGEGEGKILIGGGGAEQFTPLSAFEMEDR